MYARPSFETLPLKRVSEAVVRSKFTRFDADGSGALCLEVGWCRLTLSHPR
jgi:hypothetical protein